MTLEIFVRSRRDGEQLPQAHRRDSEASSSKTVDQVRPANDNDEAWPLIPFPDGCYGC